MLVSIRPSVLSATLSRTAKDRRPVRLDAGQEVDQSHEGPLFPGHGSTAVFSWRLCDTLP